MEEADGLVTPNSLNWNGAWALVYAKAFQVAVEHTELDDGKETQHFGNLFTIYSRYVQSMVCIITCVCVFVYEREGDRQIEKECVEISDTGHFSGKSRICHHLRC